MMVSVQYIDLDYELINVAPVNVIIFLAPLVFHQSLEEDPTVNRLVRTVIPSK